MKKTVGVLVLTLSSLVISAACASTSASSKPRPPQPNSGEKLGQGWVISTSERDCELSAQTGAASR